MHKRTITVEEELPKVEDYKMPTYKDYKFKSKTTITLFIIIYFNNSFYLSTYLNNKIIKYIYLPENISIYKLQIVYKSKREICIISRYANITNIPV